MTNRRRTKQDLEREISELRRQVERLQASEASRTLLEQALEKSETKFRTLTEKSVVGVYLIQDSLFRYVNPKLEKIFGYQPGELIDKTPVLNLVYVEDRPMLDDNLKKRLSGEIESINYNFRGLKKDGTVFYVEAYGSRMEFQGAPAVIGSLIDITERQLADEAMRAEKRRFQLLCENVPFGVIMIGKDGQYQYVNPKLIEMFEAKGDVTCSLQRHDVSPYKPVEKRIRRLIARAKDSKRLHTIQVPCSKGSRKTFQLGVVELDNGGRLVTCEDITKRIESEEALRKSERKYKTLVEEISDGYFVVQHERIVFANQAFCRIHDTVLNRVLGRPFLEFVSSECRESMMESYAGVLEGRPAEGQTQYTRVGPPKDQAATEVRARVVDLGEGPVIIGICRDISDRVAMESKVREHERMAYLGHLSASLSHEIRNPLSSIKMNLQILARKLDVDGYDRRRLEITVQQVSRLEDILRQLLDIARPLTIETAPVNLSELAGECVDLLQAKAHEKSVRIVEDYQLSLPPALLDPGKLEQALINLLLNAIEATPEGGTINIWTKSRKTARTCSLELGVKDTGPGIEDHRMPHIFNPFYTSKNHGSGLGLSNVKRIVEAHSGKIQVRSRKGLGATFVLRLPCSA